MHDLPQKLKSTFYKKKILCSGDWNVFDGHVGEDLYHQGVFEFLYKNPPPNCTFLKTLEHCGRGGGPLLKTLKA